MWQLWAVVSIICLILELSSGDFFIICFSIGAVFAIFSLLSVIFIRPVALRYLHKNEPNKPSNADALLGRTGKVTEALAVGDNGYVQIDGDLWKAVSTTDIPTGETVRVVDRQSTIITVEKL